MTKGDRIRIAREAKGLTQEELGEILGTSKQTIYKYEQNVVTNIPSDKIELMATALGVEPAYIMGWDKGAKDIIPFTASHKAPIVGSIPAGYPVLAFEEIEGYADIPYPDEENYFFLRVKGDSMEPKICTGDLVLIRRQDCAEDGQIVAARVNGDEATLKRYKSQKSRISGIFLSPKSA